MRISDWSSDVCSSDLIAFRALLEKGSDATFLREMIGFAAQRLMELESESLVRRRPWRAQRRTAQPAQRLPRPGLGDPCRHGRAADSQAAQGELLPGLPGAPARSEEHTSELQSLMRTSYAVF